MSHHKRILFIDEEGSSIDIGYVRITNEGEIISIWIDHMKRLFHPEVKE